MTNSLSLEIDGKNLTVDDVIKVAENPNHKVSISKSALVLMKKSRSLVSEIVEKGDPVYGINTGFGALSDKHIKKEDLKELQYNLIRSHCTGVSSPLSKTATRAVMLLRANCLAQGHSGINPDIVKLICEYLNHDIIPLVPSKGSVGASGDLAPLSHIALTLIGEGEVFYKNKKLPTSQALKQAELEEITLGPKDGLALINGTAVMAGLGCIAVSLAERLLKSADIIASMTLEGVRGTISAYDKRITALKPHRGQIDSCDNLNFLLSGNGISEISASHKDCGKIQDPYSLRCLPQVHGACRQTYLHTKEVMQTEINSVTDNPLIFADDKEVISGGNFHGEAISFAMDYLAMGMAEIANISERRVEKMMNPSFSSLPAFLIDDNGLNSGLMIAHVTTAALVSENKILCHPASVDSIPTSTDKEDHVSMGVTAGLKLLTIIDNVTHSLGIELLCAAQAIDFHKPLKTTAPLLKVHNLVRDHVEFISKDRVLSHEIDTLAYQIRMGHIVSAVESNYGELK
ncbi:MAG: histidine ammonia-lyase [Bacteriovoracaceae bacterium]|jgi:histidine ammonia-lyase|nr:histidine ammonia-lyase [Bacteriovoracaceae bacterium]